MTSRIEGIVQTSISRTAEGVWVTADRKTINYSDGAASERYLRRAFGAVRDLGSQSLELEGWAKDWPSEYHLTRKRSQLLRGFDFRRSDRVLEVGCGCGAITRFLGETFDSVVSIEGSMARAALARLRTRDLDSVSIICAPYQDVEFKEKFDVVFCVGVLEYAASFVPGDDPYGSVLQSFANVLKPDGQLILAIENQFGLKYFTSSREDHTNRMFEGIEGYPRWGRNVRTFGYGELKTMLEPLFPWVDYYFPYPDYKIPTCVLSERLLGKVQAGELVGQFPGRDYAGRRQPLFDERLASLELARNGLLPFFANSFLVVASRTQNRSVAPHSLGVMFNADRLPAYSTLTRFVETDDGGVRVEKAPLNPELRRANAPLALRAATTDWKSGPSLLALMETRVRSNGGRLADLFAPCKEWYEQLRSLQPADAIGQQLPGSYLDAIWGNAYREGQQYVFIDTEWEWHEPVSLNVLVIRSIYCFLAGLSAPQFVHPALRTSSTRRAVTAIGEAIGARLTAGDFEAFVRLETTLYATVTGRSAKRFEAAIRLYLWNRKAYTFALGLRRLAEATRLQAGRVGRGLRRLWPGLAA